MNESIAAGGAALFLVFVGIHNAWDTVAWITIQRTQERAAASAAEEEVARGPRERQPPEE
jgi:hypothetical protein